MLFDILFVCSLQCSPNHLLYRKLFQLFQHTVESKYSHQPVLNCNNGVFISFKYCLPVFFFYQFFSLTQKQKVLIGLALASAVVGSLKQKHTLNKYLFYFKFVSFFIFKCKQIILTNLMMVYTLGQRLQNNILT